MCVSAQCHFIPSTSLSIDTVVYSFAGGSFASYGCAPIDPTFWLYGNGISVTCTFVIPQDHPAIRVWGMNFDDSATVAINAISYYLDTVSASYAPKVVCGTSPGPDGVIFQNGKIAGVNAANYSYSDVTINTSNVSTITVTGTNGAGWGFAGVVLDCATPIAAFAANPSSVCPGTCTDFTNLSQSASSYIWNFTGASPSTSTDADPTTICYNTPGTYDVELIASNGITSDTLTLNNFITVYPYPAPQGILQSGDTLIANAGATSYQWYHDGLLIPGATEYFYVAAEGGNYNVVATDNNGCEVEAVIFDVVAGLTPALSKGEGVSIFPNPANDYLNIESDAFRGKSIELSIYNLLGENILSEVSPLSVGEGLGGEAIDVSSLPAGIYHIRINSNESIFYGMFLKN